MADKHKTQVDQNALRVVQWLMENCPDFEQQGIYEDKLAAAVGLTDLDAKPAVDYMENREELVRIPKALTTPPQFLLKPGRGWPNACERSLKKRNQSATN